VEMPRVQIWKVVGGGKQGGILVRQGRELSSPQEQERLEAGAFVEELAVAGDRLKFAKITGAGPKEGWASLTYSGQPLLVARLPSEDMVKPEWALSPSQCRIAQHLLKKSLSRREIQAKLDEAEKATGGDDDKYGKRLRGLLLSRVYPSVSEHFGFKDPMAAARTIFNSISDCQPSSHEITTAWLELETLMRNKPQMARAKEALESFRSPPSKQNLPAPDSTSLATSDPEPDLGGSADDQEVLDLDGRVVGVVDGGRIRGGCPAAGCPMFGSPRESSGPVRLCGRCGRPSTEHEDKGAFEMEDEEEIVNDARMTVCISCQKVTEKSACSIMHVTLPAGSTVADLKSSLSSGLAKDARVLAPSAGNGQTGKPLLDVYPVPPRVVLTEFRNDVTPPLVLTREQAKEAQAALKAILSESSFQKQMDSLEAEAAGNERKRNMLVMKVLVKDVYPAINRRFDLPGDLYQVTLEAIRHYSSDDIGMVESWIQLETLLRRHQVVDMAKQQLAEMRARMASGAAGA